MKHEYDILVLGGGIAGLTAALYAARGGKKTAVIERGEAGGQLTTIASIENYPGIGRVTGPELAAGVARQAEEAGAAFISADITSADFTDGVTVATSAGTLSAAGAVVALGAVAARLGLPRETELTGDGVHYCATCDGRFYKKRTVAVVGSTVKAVHDARYLSELCEKVFVVSAEPVAGLPENCECVIGEPAELVGAPLSGLKVNAGGRYVTLPVTGVFVARGFEPNSGLLRGRLELDKKGFVITDRNMKTSAPYVYAAGDIVSKPFRQAVTAAGEGAAAAHFLMRDLAAARA